MGWAVNEMITPNINSLCVGFTAGDALARFQVGDNAIPSSDLDPKFE